MTFVRTGDTQAIKQAIGDVRYSLAYVFVPLDFRPLQQDALKKEGCEKIFVDRVTGVKKNRLGLDRAMETLRKDDTLVVWRLDRLGRSLKHLIEIVGDLEEKGIGSKSIQEEINTMTSGGKLVFHIFGALAEFERNLIRERTCAGLASARARGRMGGRHRALNYHKKKIGY